LQINDLGHLLRRYHANFANGAKIKKIKIKKIPCVFAVLWYSLSMKEKILDLLGFALYTLTITSIGLIGFLLSI
jgi:hypothetical protein